MGYLQSCPIAARRKFYFKLNTAAGGILTGQTFSGAEIQISKAGGALANASGSAGVTELGATANYVVTLTAAELDTVGSLLIRVVKAGALTVEWIDEVEYALFFSAVTGTLTSSAFTTDLASSITDAHKDAMVLWHTGTLVHQGGKKIGAFNGTSKLVSLVSGFAFTGAPANGDVGQIVNR